MVKRSKVPTESKAKGRVAKRALERARVQVNEAEEPQIRVKVETCKCDGCAGLRRRYGKDSQLLQFYAKNLLIRGWAGQTDDVEKAYMASHAPWYDAMIQRGKEMAEQGFLFKPVENRKSPEASGKASRRAKTA
jgi:hypothetical protein